MTGSRTVPGGGLDPCCRDAEVRHCHACYVWHTDAGECTDGDCVLPPEAHEHQARCVDSALGCHDAEGRDTEVPGGARR